MSDHADWPDLQQAIADTGASRVLVTHGSTAVMVRWPMSMRPLKRAPSWMTTCGALRLPVTSAEGASSMRSAATMLPVTRPCTSTRATRRSASMRPAEPMTTAAVEYQYVVEPLVWREQFSHQRRGQQGKPGRRERRPERADGRRGHNRVTKPVGGSDEYPRRTGGVHGRCHCCHVVRLLVGALHPLLPCHVALIFSDSFTRSTGIPSLTG